MPLQDSFRPLERAFDPALRMRIGFTADIEFAVRDGLQDGLGVGFAVMAEPVVVPAAALGIDAPVLEIGSQRLQVRRPDDQ
jgi:hypothetical protein